MSVKEKICLALDSLSEPELKQIEEFIAFLRFRSRAHLRLEIDAPQVEALYAEFSEEDQVLAEEGMAEFEAGLAKEDKL